MAKRGKKRAFGAIRKQRSGRHQASYTGPDGHTYTARRADGGPLTFDTYADADAWLSLRRSEILRHEWMPPAAPKTTPTVSFRAYADAWLAGRKLADRTREHYDQLLSAHINPTFGDKPITKIAAADVRTWHAELGKRTGPTATAHAYGLLRTILGTAVADDVISANPCRVRGAGQSPERAAHIEPATLAELEALMSALPGKYHLLAMLGGWCALRFGELVELRRSDVDVDRGMLHVRRGVVRTKAGKKVKDPKSKAGIRKVNIPPHLMPLVRQHLREHAAMGRDGLIFPAERGGHLAPSTFYRWYYPAREAAGRPDLRFHDLRHTGSTLAASTGDATLADLMARLGHSTPAAALKYLHAAKDQDRVIADSLSRLATATEKVIRIDRGRVDDDAASGA